MASVGVCTKHPDFISRRIRGVRFDAALVNGIKDRVCVLNALRAEYGSCTEWSLVTVFYKCICKLSVLSPYVSDENTEIEFICEKNTK